VQPAGRRAARLPRPAHTAGSRRKKTALLAGEGVSPGFAPPAGGAPGLRPGSPSGATGPGPGPGRGSGRGQDPPARALPRGPPPAIVGGVRRERARITGGRVLFRGSDLLTADPAVVNQTVRGRAITFVPQDPFTSFNPVFTVGDQIMEILKWKSPRAATPPGRAWLPAVASPYPSARRRADFDAVLELLDAVELPRPDQLLP